VKPGAKASESRMSDAPGIVMYSTGWCLLREGRALLERKGLAFREIKTG